MDITDEDSIHAACEKIDGTIDIVVIATGILHDENLQPEKTLNDLSMNNFNRVFAINCFGPAMVAKYLVPKMTRDTKSVFSVLSARVGSISDNYLGGWYAYRASKAAVNMVLKNISIEVERKNKNAVVIGLHPGTVDTNLSKPFQANVKQGKLFTTDYAADQLFDVIRNCDVMDTGKLFDYNNDVIEF